MTNRSTVALAASCRSAESATLVPTNILAACQPVVSQATPQRCRLDTRARGRSDAWLAQERLPGARPSVGGSFTPDRRRECLG
jgi:hypothetical protein